MTILLRYCSSGIGTTGDTDMIFYFSGTGNSRYVAERIAEKTGEQPVSINEILKHGEHGNMESGSGIVFVVPTYAWRIPHIVEQWIRETEFTGVRRAWFVMTCGDGIGNAGKYIRKLCAEKQWEYMGAGTVVMPENYIAMFAVPKPSTARKIIRNAEPAIDRIAGLIASGQPIPDGRLSAADRIKSSLVNPVFYSMFVKADAFRATGSCIGCGTCEELCPLNNIKLQNGRPVWGNVCTHCMACISYCPEEAIEYGRKSIGKPRYHFDSEYRETVRGYRA